MKKIFEPVTLGGLPLKNRLLRSATYEGLSADPNGHLTARNSEIYETLATGEIGGIITGMYAISADGRISPDMVRAYEDSLIEPLSKMATMLHSYNCKLIVQINHGGIKAFPQGEGMLPAGASAVEPMPGHASREMTKDDIAQVVKDFGAAALRCKQAGADAVQLHGAHGYLLSQFLSPFYNFRQDEYGGSIENRARFLFEAYDEIRRAVGPNYPIWLKINCADLIENEVPLEERVWVCKQLDERGINAIEVSAGLGTGRASTPSLRVGGDIPEAYFANLADAVAKEVSTAVIGVGGYRSAEAVEKALNDTGIEGVAFSRPLIREPNLAKRWQSGDMSPSSCVSCNKCFGLKNGRFSCQLL